MTQQQPPQGFYEQDMIGAIKIKDGLFIGDELASQVRLAYFFALYLHFHYEKVLSLLKETLHKLFEMMVNKLTFDRILNSWWLTRLLI